MTSPQVVAAIIAACIAFLTLIGTLTAQYLSRRATKRDLEEQRKQIDRTLAEQRTRTLNERFASAAEQLGSDKPPEVRLAGVYAMAGLADDWEDNRQTCVDVLCGYLRMPYERHPGDEAPAKKRLAFEASREVRHTVIRVITAHLKYDAAVSWQGLNFDFTGVIFDGGDFNGAGFSGSQVRFNKTEFSGNVTFFGARFTGGRGVTFNDARFTGGYVSFFGAGFDAAVAFANAGFSGGTVDFSKTRFSSAAVMFDSADFSGGEIHFNGAEFFGGQVRFSLAKFGASEVDFRDAKFTAGEVDFRGAEFTADGTVDFRGAEFSGSMVNFRGARFSGGTVDFHSAQFSGGTVGFDRAGFSGGTVDFRSARFSGGTVDFSKAGEWSVPPAFPWTDTPPPGVKLPKRQDQSQA